MESENFNLVSLPGENLGHMPQSATVQRELTKADNEDEAKTVGKKQNRIDCKYNYTKDQWSPLNPEGKKQYSREFLLYLRHQPMSLRKPEDVQNLNVINYERYKDYLLHFPKKKKKLQTLTKKVKKIGNETNEPPVPGTASTESKPTLVEDASLDQPHSSLTTVNLRFGTMQVSERNPTPVPKIESKILNVVSFPVQNPVSTPQSDTTQSGPTNGKSSISVNADKRDETKTVWKKQNQIVLKCNYTENQWSPLNPESKKQYSREFLFYLRSQPMSLRKPEDVQNLNVTGYERYKDYIQYFPKKKKKPKALKTKVKKSKSKTNEPPVPGHASAESKPTVVAQVSETPAAPPVTKVTPTSLSALISERNTSLPIMEYEQSPLDPDGKKLNGREFLFQLQSQPTSLCKSHDSSNLNVMKYESNKPQNLCSLRKEEEKPKEVISIANSQNQNIKLNKSRNTKSPSESEIPPVNIWIPGSKYHLRRKFDDVNLSEISSGANLSEDTWTSDPSTSLLAQEDSN